MENKVMDELLYLYDSTVRNADSDYNCGYADAVGQCILNLGDVLGETWKEPYKFEACKRVYQFETVRKYKNDYPVRIKKQS